jgi:hypothetical protein
MAPTLAYDSEITGDSAGGTVPAELAGRVSIETLVLIGGARPAWTIDIGRQVADALPNGQHLCPGRPGARRASRGVRAGAGRILHRTKPPRLMVEVWENGLVVLLVFATFVLLPLVVAFFAGDAVAGALPHVTWRAASPISPGGTPRRVGRGMW